MKCAIHDERNAAGTCSCSDIVKELRTDKRNTSLRAFVVGFINGRHSLGNHDAVGHEAQAAFDKWWSLPCD